MDEAELYYGKALSGFDNVVGWFLPSDVEFKIKNYPLNYYEWSVIALANLKVITCVESTEKYENFLDIVKQRTEDIFIATDLSALQNKLLHYDNISVIFIDCAFLHEITEELSDILQSGNCLCIALCKEYTDILNRKPYIYDILECKNPCNINNFLIRLEKDINCRLQLKSMEYEIKGFYNVAKELSAEKDIEKALDIFINTCMDITSSDAGTVYVVVDSEDGKWSTYENNTINKFLKFTIAKNRSIDLNLKSTISPISKESIFGYTVIIGQPLRIDDAYNIPDSADYHFNPEFDKTTGYRTKSIMTIPMKDHRDRILGVVQLINKKDGDKIIPFNSRDEMIIYSLSGQAAVTLENNILYHAMDHLLEEYRLLINEEIVKRKRADEEINKLLSAVEHSPVSVLITDAYGRIEYVNPKFTSLTGYTPEEVIGKNPKILSSGIHSKDFYKDLWSTILSGREWHGELYNKNKKGEFYWESTSISSLKNPDGLIKYFIAVSEDITEKKLIIKKIEEKNVELQETINRLNEAQSQLVQKEKMAAIGQLAAGVAHEINNPLGFIMSNFETLQKYFNKLRELLLVYRDFVTNCADKYSDDIKREIKYLSDYERQNKIDFLISDLPGLFTDTSEGFERVKNIVNALRTFSHVDKVNDYEEYDLNAGIKTTLLIARNYIKYTAKVHKELGDIPLIEASGGEINQVILNLLLNAAYAIKLKDSDDIGVIKIKTYQKENDIYCEIIDNGIGMEKEVLSKIFEPFYTTKPVGEGTGLGLSLSYDIIVKKHNGEITVDSTHGVGTKFTFKLPIKQHN